MVSVPKTDWDQKLPSAVHAYNTSEKRTTSKVLSSLYLGRGQSMGVQLELETLRIMAYREGTQTEDLGYQMMAIQDLEEARTEALERTIFVQALLTMLIKKQI